MGCNLSTHTFIDNNQKSHHSICTRREYPRALFCCAQIKLLTINPALLHGLRSVDGVHTVVQQAGHLAESVLQLGS